jgi:hypothetical protein
MKRAVEINCIIFLNGCDTDYEAKEMVGQVRDKGTLVASTTSHGAEYENIFNKRKKGLSGLK